MIRSTRTVWMALAAVFAGQIAALGYMVWDRTSLLRNGREIVLDVIPVDPRSLFRGDYVILSYAISQAPATLMEGPPPARNAAVYARIAPEGTGWKVVGLTSSYPVSVANGEIVLQGKSHWFDWMPASRPNQRVPLGYGIESYFVPEGKGRDLENLVREKKISAIVAVDGKGRSAIKGLAVDGQRIWEEPFL